jgi:orotate phosphoribosyltransferase
MLKPKAISGIIWADGSKLELLPKQFVPVCHFCKHRKNDSAQVPASKNLMLPQSVKVTHPHNRPLGPAELEWISTSQLVEDGLKLVQFVDESITGIIGVPRSGMIPATAVATHCHLPLYELTPKGPRQLEAGSRSISWGKLPKPSRFLLIDDSSHNGGAMQRARQTLKDYDVKYAAVYTLSADNVDCYARLLDKVHIFDWNIFNNGLMEGHAIDARLRGGFMFDFDGVLCPDTPFPHTDDQEERVKAWLRDVRPMRWIPRFAKIPFLVSFRLEKHRQIIEGWLRKWRVRVGKLILHPAQTFTERDANFDVVQHKAERFRQSACTLFVESCPIQSEIIAKHSKKPVMCPSVGRFFGHDDCSLYFR